MGVPYDHVAGFGCDLAHLGDKGAKLTVVADPLLVEGGLGVSKRMHNPPRSDLR